MHDLSKLFSLILVSCEDGKNLYQSLGILKVKLADASKLGTLKLRTHEECEVIGKRSVPTLLNTLGLQNTLLT